MCEWGDTVPLKVWIPKQLSHTGEARWDEKPVDACISRIVQALNDGGVCTIASCCGHGKGDGSILLAGGRELVVVTPNNETSPQ